MLLTNQNKIQSFSKSWWLMKLVSRVNKTNENRRKHQNKTTNERNNVSKKSSQKLRQRSINKSKSEHKPRGRPSREKKEQDQI